MVALRKTDARRSRLWLIQTNRCLFVLITRKKNPDAGSLCQQAGIYALLLGTVTHKGKVQDLIKTIDNASRDVLHCRVSYFLRGSGRNHRPPGPPPPLFRTAQVVRVCRVKSLVTEYMSCKFAFSGVRDKLLDLLNCKCPFVQHTKPKLFVAFFISRSLVCFPSLESRLPSLTPNSHRMRQCTRIPRSQCTKMGLIHVCGCVHSEVYVHYHDCGWVPSNPKRAECCKSCA